ncbi:MAG: serine/threonine protein phosphatase [Rhodopirellula sp.]|nr:serine/threonine protein phosphatase [Rhodopirellula sp.]
MPRNLAIGDIHGHLNALQTLVGFVAPNNDDTLITVGDYVDRGPDSAGVLDWLIERFEAGQLVPLRGNHDIMMLDALDSGEWQGSWQSFGGDTTLESYRRRGFDPEADGLPKRHRQFIESDCRKIHVTDNHFFVHANAHDDMPFEDQPDRKVYWEKWFDPSPHVSGKTMICGHTAQKNGWPLTIGHAVCIDTWVYGKTGWLTCLDVDLGEVWQARESGETRSGWLGEAP